MQKFPILFLLITLFKLSYAQNISTVYQLDTIIDTKIEADYSQFYSWDYISKILNNKLYTYIPSYSKGDTFDLLQIDLKSFTQKKIQFTIPSAEFKTTSPVIDDIAINNNYLVLAFSTKSFAVLKNNNDNFTFLSFTPLSEKFVGERKRYETFSTIDGKQLTTISLIDGRISSTDYVESIRSSIFNLCPEGFSPWSPRLYESICFGAIPLIIAESIVLPFERFIDWRSFSTKFHAHNVRNMIDVILEIDQFQDYVEKKLKNAATYFHAFRWPYTPVDKQHDRHWFLPEEDSNGTIRNVFHYLSLELRCRRLEQFYGLVSDHFSMQSIKAKRQACTHHPNICPCYEEEKSLAVEEFL